MNAARIIFGIIYLGGAATNIAFLLLYGPELYYAFADRAIFTFYIELWRAVAVPNMIHFIYLLLFYELTMGLMFVANRKFMRPALVMGIVFCLATAPVMPEAIYINIPLALIQGFLLWRECRLRSIQPD